MVRSFSRRRLMPLLPLLVATVAGCFGAASALYSKRSGVETLSAAEFDERVIHHDGISVVQFYAPWCGHSKNIVPEYRKAAAALKGVARVYAVDGDAEKQLSGKYDIKGFPTIKFFVGDKKKPVDHNGGRTASAIVDGLLSAARSAAQAKLGGGSGSGSGSGSRPGSGQGQAPEPTPAATSLS